MRAASIAALPPPTTTTFFPAKSGFWSRLTSRRKVMASSTPARSSSPGICSLSPLWVPSARKTALKPCASSESIVKSFPSAWLTLTSTPREAIWSTSFWTTSFGRR